MASEKSSLVVIASSDHCIGDDVENTQLDVDDGPSLKVFVASTDDCVEKINEEASSPVADVAWQAAWEAAWQAAWKDAWQATWQVAWQAAWKAAWQKTQFDVDDGSPLKISPASTDDCVQEINKEATTVVKVSVPVISDNGIAPAPGTTISWDASLGTSPLLKKQIDHQLFSPWKLGKISSVDPCQSTKSTHYEDWVEARWDAFVRWRKFVEDDPLLAPPCSFEEFLRAQSDEPPSKKTCMVMEQCDDLHVVLLVMSMAAEVFEYGQNKSHYFLIWALDEHNTWCKLEGWGNDAEKMQLCLARLLPEGHGYISFSTVRHAQSFKGSLKNCMAFTVNPGCQYVVCQGFDEDDKLSLPPQPRINSDCSTFSCWSDLYKCFISVQMHEFRETMPESPETRARLLLVLWDMSERLRRGKVWPKFCCLDIWSEGGILTMLGCSVSMQHSNATIGSDSLEMPFTSQTLADSSGSHYVHELGLLIF